MYPLLVLTPPDVVLVSLLLFLVEHDNEDAFAGWPTNVQEEQLTKDKIIYKFAFGGQ